MGTRNQRTFATRLAMETLEQRQLMAGDLTLLADIEQGYHYNEGPQAQSTTVQVGGFTYFINHDSLSGDELWRTDGTAAGTGLVVDLLPGIGNGVSTRSLTVFQGKLYFLGNDGLHGERIYTSDGTAVGTYAISDYTFAPLQNLYTRTAVGSQGMLISRFDDPIMASDGTAAGTRPLTVEGTGETLHDPVEFFTHNGRVYFSARNEVGGEYRFWSSDGATARPMLATGEQLTGVLWVVASNDETFLFATPGYNGGAKEVWRWDAATQAPVRLLASENEPFTAFRLIGDRLYATRTRVDLVTEVLSADLATGASELIAAFPPQITDTNQPFAVKVTLLEIDGRAFFHATSLGQADTLWSTTGAAAGTRLLRELPFSSTYLATSFAITRAYGVPSPGPTPQAFIQFQEAGDKLYVALHGGPEYDWQLWAIDGAGNSVLLAQQQRPVPLPRPSIDLSQITIAPVYGPMPLDSASPIGDPEVVNIQIFAPPIASPLQFWTVRDGKLYFSTRSSGTGHQTWISDGTAAGTRVLSDQGSNAPVFFTHHGDLVLFTATTGASPNSGASMLHRTDGTSVGTQLVGSLSPATAGSAPRAFQKVGERVYFIVDNAKLNASYVVYFDESTGIAHDLTLDNMLLSVDDHARLARIGDRLYTFSSNHPRTLFVIEADGSVRGIDLSGLDIIEYYSLTGLVALDGQLYFQARGLDSVWALWKSDGATFTKLITLPDIHWPTEGLRAEVINQQLYLQDDSARCWRFDSTTNTLVLTPAVATSEIAVGSYTYYVGGNGQLWRRVDEQNTQVTSIPGVAAVRDLTRLGDIIFFTADDGTHGRELWKFDLVTHTAQLVSDLRPGAQGSDPAALTALGDTLYFAAHDGVHGSEPWRWRADTSTSSTTPPVEPVVGDNPFHNDAWNVDVNQDGLLTPLDALLVLMALNERGPGALPTIKPANDITPQVDVNGDGHLTPHDVLMILLALDGRDDG